LQGKASAKNLLKGIVAPAYNIFEHHATVKAYQNAYKYGDAVILLSDSYISAYKEFAHLKDTNKLLAIPNCLPFEHTLTNEEIEAKDKTALVVGRMVDFPKRISLILKMWQTIEQHPVAKDWNLDIVGDGPDLETFKSLANKLGLLHCTFHGRKDPIDYYRRSSLFFMTSEFEGFPMTLVEAQMMGCIPVSFDTFDSLKEVVTDKENGRIIPNNDTEKYVDTVIELMNSSDTRLKLVKNALNNCQRYSQQTICNRWKSLIEYLVVSRL
jgi:glycosyltransferase involved in cell wall biosynthesis